MDFNELRPHRFSEQNQGLKKLFQEVQELRRIVALAEIGAEERRLIKAASTKKPSFIVEADSCSTGARA